MAQFRRIDVILKMEQFPLVPVFYHNDIDICLNIIKSCYNGGIRVFEFTNRGDFTQDIFGEMIKYIKQDCPEMILGAGTIADAGTASLFIQKGANFIVSPFLNQDIFKVCNRRKILHIPGCASLTEVSQAEEYGAEIVKIFPGDVLKPQFIKNLKGPMPWSSLMVTGGVEANEESLKSWFNAGATCVGLGSQVFTKELIESKNYKTLEEKIRLLWGFLK